MSFSSQSLAQPRPDSIRACLELPRLQQSHAAFVDWRDEELYFLTTDDGDDYGQDRYLDVLDRNLNAALDIGEMRPTLTGIPCVYYGTELALAGPEAGEQHWLPDWGGSDRYLREAMFVHTHSRKSGRAGTAIGGAGHDPTLPGFGAFGSAGQHCFDTTSASYRRIVALLELRKQNPCLRHGRQYPRPIAYLGYPFAVHGPGELIVWSRILDDEEVMCIVNGRGTEARGGDVLVDATLKLPGDEMQVLLNTAESGNPRGYDCEYSAGTIVLVCRTEQGISYIEILALPEFEVLLLSNKLS